MKLKQLFKQWPVTIHGDKNLQIFGLSSHSKTVKMGELFIARKGSVADGSLYIEGAIEAGASAILTDFYNPLLPKVTQVIYPHPEELEARLAQIFYEDPSSSLFTVGITGTNGKTTTAFLLSHLLENKPYDCGLIGTIENRIGKRILPAKLTTPDVITLQRYFKEMLQEECSSCVMEVTSHGIHQKRIEGIDFDVAVFTNFSQDHLDYHQTMENYLEAKASFFDHLGDLVSRKHFEKIVVVNIDDAKASRIIKNTQAKIITYGLSADATVRAVDPEYLPDCTKFTLHVDEKKLTKVISPLIGTFNLYNLLSSIAVCLEKGVTMDVIQQRLMTFEGVPGRLQRIQVDHPFSVFVDFAHTEDALRNVLITLKNLQKAHRIITVFGCGGNRDPLKRPLMGQAAEELSDEVIITSDNPRTEDPMHIIEEILQGITKHEKIHVEVDRKKAIQKAISLAKKGDIVLLAGKGHEKTQIFKDRIIEFDDVVVAQEAGRFFNPA